MKKYKYIGILTIILIIVISGFLFLKSKNKVDDDISEFVLDDIYPESSNLAEITLGTYYNGTQTDYCKIKIPENYSGWSMYLTKENENINFEMANSHELSYSIANGLLDSEESIQQFHYSNTHLVADESTDIYANIFTSDQIVYEDMKNQTSNAKEISDIAFYSKGDEKYTDIDVTLYYKINDNITLQISYKSPVTASVGAKKIANELYKLIEIIK